ncbi:MAG TPA: exopolysaccharide Pel transporter PelG [Terriglobia bacterium]|nr:exopolysaccharide Pel transporter PelG [Terriglobia bacterium]
MAGIGFELRKLERRDDLLGVVEGYAHSALASTGPWLFTILSLSGTVMFGSRFVSVDEMTQFRLIIIYNFAFSLVMSAPISVVSSRHLADSIYRKDLTKCPAALLSGILIVFALELPLVIMFYGYFLQLDLAVRLFAIANFFVVTAIWLACVFLTALKDYKRLSFAFAAGMGAALAGAMIGAPFFKLPGMLFGFTAGLILLLCHLIGCVLAEYPYGISLPMGFGKQLRHYWDLALGGLVYNTAIWIDKCLMWSAPERVSLPSGMVSYPDYDSAMFLAFLTIVPSMACFVLSVETDFFEKYVQYYRDIQQHATFSRIQRNHQAIIQSVKRGSRNFIVLQGFVSLISIFLAPRLFAMLNVSFIQMAVFRIGVLGAFFHVLFLTMTILLSYFDKRKLALAIQLVFLATNTIFTLLTLRMGFQFYGYGYFVSTIITFALTFLALARVLNRLPYETFVLNNSSVK